jgi:hypothetical protein
MTKKYKWIDKELQIIKEISKGKPERRKKMLKDYEDKGWTDRDTWSLDYTIAQFVLPRLKRFREVASGCPGIFCPIDDNGKPMKGRGIPKDGMKHWHKLLDEMIVGFQLMNDGNQFLGSKEDYKKMNKALDLFREFFFDLWW